MVVPTVVAVLNTSDDTVEMLRLLLEGEGFLVISGHTSALRRGEQSIVDDVAEHDPAVLIYDVGVPYDANWRFFEHMRHHPSMKGRRWVVTSTNPDRVHQVAKDSAGATIYEVIGKPYDLQQIVDAVRRELSTRDQ